MPRNLELGNALLCVAISLDLSIAVCEVLLEYITLEGFVSAFL